jgi:group I intron endonuclease
MTSGIYSIENKINGKLYVGSSRTVERRCNGHARKLRDGIHKNLKLQHAWEKYGEVNFTFNILEVVEDTSLLYEYEQDWLDELDCVNLGYNIARSTDAPMRGRTVSEETRKKFKNRKHGAGMTGKKHSEETKQKLRDANKNAMQYKGLREKLSASAKARFENMTKEERRAIMAKCGPISKEIRKKMGEARRGKSTKPHSEAAKQKIRESLIAYWKKRKAETI